MKKEKIVDDVYIEPADGKYDFALIFLHGLGDSAFGFHDIFYDYKLLGVSIFIF